MSAGRMEKFWDYVSISIVGLYVFPLIRYGETGKLVFIFMLIGLALADFTTKVVKEITRDWEHDALKRPTNASNCDFFCRTLLL